MSLKYVPTTEYPLGSIDYYPDRNGAGDSPTPTLTAEEWNRLPQIPMEDDDPVDNFLSAKNQRLLVDILYATWIYLTNVRFLADANVGIFSTMQANPIVPDMFLSLNVTPPPDWWQTHVRSYLVPYFGKPPDLVVEIVSNTIGREDSNKKTKYADLGVPYYVIYDPYHQLGREVLRSFALDKTGLYIPMQRNWFPTIGLGLRVWTGTYEEITDSWLRWCDADGQIIWTGKERGDHEAHAKEQALRRAEQEAQRADQATLRAEYEAQAKALVSAQLERMKAKMRELGIVLPEDEDGEL